LYRTRPILPTQMRLRRLTRNIREMHPASRHLRIPGGAQLAIGMEIQVSEGLIGVLMRRSGVYGLPAVRGPDPRTAWSPPMT
jgi:hypothetical protein